MKLKLISITVGVLISSAANAATTTSLENLKSSIDTGVGNYLRFTPISDSQQGSNTSPDNSGGDNGGDLTPSNPSEDLADLVEGNKPYPECVETLTYIASDWEPLFLSQTEDFQQEQEIGINYDCSLAGGSSNERTYVKETRDIVVIATPFDDVGPDIPDDFYIPGDDCEFECGGDEMIFSYEPYRDAKQVGALGGGADEGDGFFVEDECEIECGPPTDYWVPSTMEIAVTNPRKDVIQTLTFGHATGNDYTFKLNDTVVYAHSVSDESDDSVRLSQLIKYEEELIDLVSIDNTESVTFGSELVKVDLGYTFDYGIEFNDVSVTYKYGDKYYPLREPYNSFYSFEEYTKSALVDLIKPAKSEESSLPAKTCSDWSSTPEFINGEVDSTAYPNFEMGDPIDLERSCSQSSSSTSIDIYRDYFYFNSSDDPLIPDFTYLNDPNSGNWNFQPIVSVNDDGSDEEIEYKDDWEPNKSTQYLDDYKYESDTTYSLEQIFHYIMTDPYIDYFELELDRQRAFQTGYTYYLPSENPNYRYDYDKEPLASSVSSVYEDLSPKSLFIKALDKVSNTVISEYCADIYFAYGEGTYSHHPVPDVLLSESEISNIMSDVRVGCGIDYEHTFYLKDQNGWNSQAVDEYAQTLENPSDRENEFTTIVRDTNIAFIFTLGEISFDINSAMYTELNEPVERCDIDKCYSSKFVKKVKAAQKYRFEYGVASPFYTDGDDRDEKLLEQDFYILQAPITVRDNDFAYH